MILGPFFVTESRPLAQRQAPPPGYGPIAAKQTDLGLLLEERAGAAPATTSRGLRWEVEAAARLSALDSLSLLHGCPGGSARRRPQASASRAAAGEQG